MNNVAWWNQTGVSTVESITDEHARWQLFRRAANGEAGPIGYEYSGGWENKGSDTFCDALRKMKELGLTVASVEDEDIIAVNEGAYVKTYFMNGEATVKVICNGGNEKATLIAEAITRGWKKRVVDDLRGEIHMMAYQHGSLTFKSIGRVGLPFEQTNYEKNVEADFNRTASALAESDPSGRLVLFEGPPGCGKTHLIRALVETLKHKCFFALLSASAIEALSRPEIIPALLSQKQQISGTRRFVLVCEDADACLVPRSDKSLGSISALLNLSDGIIGSALDIRVVATTNAVVNDIDPALLRHGRLLLRSHVGLLKPSTQESVLRRLGVCDEQASAVRGVDRSLADVYALADMVKR